MVEEKKKPPVEAVVYGRGGLAVTYLPHVIAVPLALGGLTSVRNGKSVNTRAM